MQSGIQYDSVEWLGDRLVGEDLATSAFTQTDTSISIEPIKSIKSIFIMSYAERSKCKS